MSAAQARPSRILGRAFAHLLVGKGYNFFAGVPCSLLKDLIPEIEALSAYYPETREDAAIGLAAGAWMAGKKPGVLMQNSGLGVCLNALTSMSMMYEIPTLILMSYRGRGPDAPEHLLMGSVCETILGTIGIPRRVLAADNLEDALFWAEAWLTEKSTPACLLVPPGLFDGGGHA